MDWKFECDPAGVTNAVLHSSGETHVNAIARRQIASRLRDTDHGASGLQLRPRNPVVVVTFKINCSFSRLRHIVKPDLAAEPSLRSSFVLDFHIYHFSSRSSFMGRCALPETDHFDRAKAVKKPLEIFQTLLIM